VASVACSGWKYRLEFEEGRISSGFRVPRFGFGVIENGLQIQIVFGGSVADDIMQQ
jgi:hypothetical protein